MVIVILGVVVLIVVLIEIIDMLSSHSRKNVGSPASDDVLRELLVEIRELRKEIQELRRELEE